MSDRLPINGGLLTDETKFVIFLKDPDIPCIDINYEKNSIEIFLYLDNLPITLTQEERVVFVDGVTDVLKFKMLKSPKIEFEGTQRIMVKFDPDDLENKLDDKRKYLIGKSVIKELSDLIRLKMENLMKKKKN